MPSAVLPALGNPGGVPSLRAWPPSTRNQGRALPALHREINQGMRLPCPRNLCMKENPGQGFSNPGISGHRTQKRPHFPGWICTRLSEGGAAGREQSQLEDAPRETSAGDAPWEQELISSCAPPPFCPTHQEMVGTSCCPSPMGTHSPGSLHHVSQDCSSAMVALLGSSPHTAVGTCHEQLQTS